MLQEEHCYETEQEAVNDFLNNNLLALREYNSRFANCVHHDCMLAIVSNAQRSIKKIYAKRINNWYRDLPFLKNYKQANHIASCVKELGTCEPAHFREKIGGLITDINISLNHDR